MNYEFRLRFQNEKETKKRPTTKMMYSKEGTQLPDGILWPRENEMYNTRPRRRRNCESAYFLAVAAGRSLPRKSTTLAFCKCTFVLVRCEMRGNLPGMTSLDYDEYYDRVVFFFVAP